MTSNCDLLLPKAPTSFEFSVRFSKEQGSKTIEKTLALWQELMNKILILARKQKEISEEHMQKFLSDRVLFQNYKSIEGYIKQALKHQDEEVVVYEILDTDQKVQAIAAVRINSNHVYISGLISAPWNLRINSDISELKFPERKKGAGSAAFYEAYRLAQDKHKIELQTTPLSDAISFYTQFKMTFDEQRKVFTLPVKSE